MKMGWGARGSPKKEQPAEMEQGAAGQPIVGLANIRSLHTALSI